IEVKTFLDNKRGRISMHRKAKDRKLKYAEDTGYQWLTVVIDERDAWGKRSDLYSGHKLWVKEGVGGFSLETMKPLVVEGLSSTEDLSKPTIAEEVKKAIARIGLPPICATTPTCPSLTGESSTCHFRLSSRQRHRASMSAVL